ncbi:transglutaminase domain-containing protein [Bifidobacterium simiiventris]|uniref:transglutaminase domain-containing protein n=1 Tax=Bifidobacterium simiiventris TaxID=2834434 RepID=UPI001C597011|nr:transglutaminase domain-containing protein [Bifidobacterium simiiventris]MBW3077640.1 hypothetical protein [Bifidobacterium simiiventris]
MPQPQPQSAANPAGPYPPQPYPAQSQQPYRQPQHPNQQPHPGQPYPFPAQPQPTGPGANGKRRRKWPFILIAVLAVIACVIGGLFVASSRSDNKSASLPTAEQAYGSALPASKYELRDPIVVDIYHEFRITLKGKASVVPDDYWVFKLKGADMTTFDCAKVYQDAALSVPVPTSANAGMPESDKDGNGVIDVGGEMDIPEYLRDGNDDIGSDHGFLPSDGYYYVQYMGEDGSKLAKPIVQFFKVVNPTDVEQLSPVNGITPTVNAQGGVDISWSKLEGAKSYNVYAYIVTPQVGQPGDDYFAEERSTVTKIGSSTTTTLLSKDYDKPKSHQLVDGTDAVYSQNEAYQSLAVERQDAIDSCQNATDEYCANILQQAGGSYDPGSAGKLYFIVTAVDADGHEGRWRAVDASSIVPSIPLTTAEHARVSQWFYGLSGAFGEKNTADESMQAYAYTFVTMANGATAPIPSTFSDLRRDENSSSSWRFTVSAPGTMITNSGSLYYEGDLNQAFAQITQAALRALPKAGGVLDRINAVRGDTDWSGYDAKDIDSDTKQSQYFTYASTEYGTYLANNILNGHEVIDITDYATDDYQVSTSDVMNEVISQNPYIRTDSSGVSYTVRKKGDRTVMWVHYPQDYAKRQQQIADFVDSVKGRFQGSARDKAIAIDQFLAARMTYDYDALNSVGKNGEGSAFESSQSSEQYPNAWSAYGMVDGKGVCLAYAYAYQLLAKAAGLDTRVVIGSVTGTTASHAWNYVDIDGTWLLVDSTWDDDGDTAIDKYQLKDKSEVSDHQAFNDQWTLASQSGQY